MSGPIAWNGPCGPWIASTVWPVRSAQWTLQKRRLYDYLLVCSFDGSEWIRVDGQRDEIAVPRGASYLLPPGLLVDKGSRSGNRPAMCHFDLRYHPQREHRPRQAAFDHDLRGREAWLQPTPKEIWGVDLPILLPSDLWPACRAAMPHIVTAWSDGDPWSTLRAQQRLHDLLLSFVEGTAARQAMRTEPGAARITRAEQVARLSLGSPFGVDQFAAAAGLRRSHFHRLYRELRGISPAVFLRRERLANAKRLLRRPDLSVAAIGRLIGYEDPAVFTRAFRRDFGATPSDWRRRLRS